MKKSINLGILLLMSMYLAAQKDTFDITTYTAPRDWQQQKGEGAILFAKQEPGQADFCMISLYKAVPGRKDGKENFDSAWKILVKDLLHVAAPPDMQPVALENGWEIQSGFAPFESEGTNGYAMLVTSSDPERMVNIVVLFNSDRYQQDVSTFLESVGFDHAGQAPATAGSGSTGDLIGNWGRMSSDKISYYNSSTNTTVGGLSSSSSIELKADGSYIQMTLAMSGYPNYKVFSHITGTYTVNGNTLTLVPIERRYRKWQNGALISDETDRPSPLVQRWDIRTQPSTGKPCLYLVTQGETLEREYCRE